MNLKELRIKLLRYPDDILASFALDKLAKYVGEYPSNGNRSAIVQFIISTYERKKPSQMDELEDLANVMTARVRRLLREGFSESDLYAFMFDSPQFRERMDDIGRGKEKGVYISNIIEECEQHPEKYTTLLAWASKENPNRYAHIMWSWK